jgi:hypothetical protein
MSEWWTYRLSSFLLFSPRTYYRLFELYNEAVFPAQLATLALGVAILALASRGDARAGRFAAAFLGGLWLVVAFAFHWSRYATINWAATWFAAGFALEAALIFWSGVLRAPIVVRPGVGLAIFLFALVVEPLIGPLFGRAWSGIEIFGLAPDPTTVATLGVLVASERPRWSLMILPLAWCMASGATLWAMAAPDAFVPPLAAAAALFIAAWKTVGRGKAAAPVGSASASR